MHGMMGGGLCWIDFNNDGRLDLFAVNSYTDANKSSPGSARRTSIEARSSRTSNGHFADVSRRSHANVATQGNGCVAADLNGDGYEDLLVTTNTYNVLLWNNGDGTFTTARTPRASTRSGRSAGTRAPPPGT